MREYTIASGTCFYNDFRSLTRTLDSLTDKVDLMICVDGRYKHFKDDNPEGLSNDMSRSLVKSYNNAILLDMPDSYEIEKRQKYLEVCSATSDSIKDLPIDYLLIVDSDEYVLEYDAKVFEEELSRLRVDQAMSQYNVFAVMLEVNSGNYDHIIHKLSSNAGPPQPTTPDNRQFSHAPRLWHKPYEMEYNVRHYNFRNKHPSSSLHNMETNPAVKIIPGLKLGHDHALRTQAFLDKRYPYQKWLVDFEQNKLQEYERLKKVSPQIDEYDKIDNSG